MDEHNDRIKNNKFLTRGCKSIPKGTGKEERVFHHGCCKLDSTDWLNGVNFPRSQKGFDCVEVRFKNSHKDFYRIGNGHYYNVGDIVAVESAPGHDIGICLIISFIIES